MKEYKNYWFLLITTIIVCCYLQYNNYLLNKIISYNQEKSKEIENFSYNLDINLNRLDANIIKYGDILSKLKNQNIENKQVNLSITLLSAIYGIKYAIFHGDDFSILLNYVYKYSSYSINDFLSKNDNSLNQILKNNHGFKSLIKRFKVLQEEIHQKFYREKWWFLRFLDHNISFYNLKDGNIDGILNEISLALNDGDLNMIENLINNNIISQYKDLILSLWIEDLKNYIDAIKTLDIIYEKIVKDV
ncbi:MAG: hypothetical protein OEY79_01110 [Anaplasmataceae bacterium]|nr:hypothetical protein [Anaplasmataceae bacterium]